MGKCVHRWRIDEARGRYSQGVCKHCGESREFENSRDYTSFYKPARTSAGAKS